MADTLRAQQERFAAHIRNPDSNPAPDDVEDRRMAIYRELFFNNLSNFIARSFPVLRKLFDEEGWNRMMRHFYTVHACHTPLFPEIPREFLQYLQDERGPQAGDPPFLLELAHYEWVELALDLDERELEDVPADRDGDLLTGVPVLSPLAWPLAYRFPVHRISPENKPEAAPDTPTHLLVYRTRQDQVKFMQLNGVTARMLTLLSGDTPAAAAPVKALTHRTGLSVLNAIADELDHPKREQLIQAGAAALQDLADRDVILGTRPAAAP